MKAIVYASTDTFILQQRYSRVCIPPKCCSRRSSRQRKSASYTKTRAWTTIPPQPSTALNAKSASKYWMLMTLLLNATKLWAVSITTTLIAICRLNVWEHWHSTKRILFFYTACALPRSSLSKMPWPSNESESTNYKLAIAEQSPKQGESSQRSILLIANHP